MKLELDGVSQNFPDFLIVGAGKCGTSSLHYYLAAHPDVFLPKQKELWFWHQNRNPNQAIFDHFAAPTDLESYLEWFADAKDGQIVGEVCPSYLYYHDFVIESLKEYHPQWDQVKIVIILRDPLERIFSQYRFVRQMGRENLSFAEAISEEPRRKADLQSLLGLHYLSVSLYSDQLKAYQESFENVKVFLYEDLAKDPGVLMRDLCAFLGVDEEFANAIDYSKKHNVSRAARIGRFSGAATTYEWFRHWGRSSPATFRAPFKKLLDVFFRTNEVFDPDLVDPEIKQDLKQKLRPDVEKVADLTGMDLSCWKTVLD